MRNKPDGKSMAKSSFGETLKRERELRGLTLDEVAAATRISTRFLHALENEQWDKLPGGIFNRGFVRAVARYLGVDEEELIAEYALATNDRPQVAVWADKTPRAKKHGWVLLLFVVVILVAAGTAGWFAWHLYEARLRAWWSPPAPTNPVIPAPPSAGSEGPAPAPASTVTGAPELLELKVEAGRTTTITIIADGQTLFDGRLRAGEHRTFQAREQLQITAGDPSDVLLELNGQTLPPLGPPGTPATVTLTRADLKPAGGQN
jgi:cytoskeletal protein RodZ